MIYFLTQSALKANAVDNTSWAWYIDLSTARSALRVSSFCLAAVGLQIEKYQLPQRRWDSLKQLGDER